MKLKSIVVILLSFFSINVGRAVPVESLSAAVGQKGMPFEYVQVPDDPNSFYHVQRTRPDDNRLFLTSNNVYFRTGSLIADAEGPTEIQKEGIGTPEFGGRGVNNGASFAYVRNWSEGSQAEWGLWLENEGTLDMAIQTNGAPGAVFRVSIDDQEKQFASRSGNDGSMRQAHTKTFRIPRPGFYTVTLTCLRPDESNDVRINWLELSGPAAVNGGVVRVRWRPAASHARFSSTKVTAPVRMWVMELDAVPAMHGFYGPITTPFGYYGSSWQADGRVSTSLNFSLWSYGQRAEEPPIGQLSQIIAVGHPDAVFGGFGHEGTGVKIRGWRPFEGRQGQRQVYALRVESGQPSENYDTYYTYFYANDKNRWMLYGIGENFNRRRAEGRRDMSAEMTLWAGSFVEVVGGAPRERTGIYERRQRYRGWVMDNQGSWFALDRMTYGNVNRETGLTHTDRGIDTDGWFWNQTGGWTWRKPKGVGGEFVRNRNTTAMSDVSYLQPEDIAALLSVPCEITICRATRHASTLTLEFSVRNAGAGNRVSAFWGPDDARAITYPKTRWPYSDVIMTDAREGLNQVVIPDVVGDGDLYIRLLLENDKGRFFSRETYRMNSR